MQMTNRHAHGRLGVKGGGGGGAATVQPYMQPCSHIHVTKEDSQTTALMRYSCAH